MVQVQVQGIGVSGICFRNLIVQFSLQWELILVYCMRHSVFNILVYMDMKNLMEASYGW